MSSLLGHRTGKLTLKRAERNFVWFVTGQTWVVVLQFLDCGTLKRGFVGEVAMFFTGS